MSRGHSRLKAFVYLVLKAVGGPVRLLLVWGDSEVGKAKAGNEESSGQSPAARLYPCSAQDHLLAPLDTQGQ